MNGSKTLLEQDNAISLRTALVLDDGNSVYLCLMPAELESLTVDRVSKDSTYLYRHLRSPAAEAALTDGPFEVEQNLRPMVFENGPSLRLIWTDSGNGLALYLNGEPWAFIDEATHEAYSKGILPPRRGMGYRKLWDQTLFEQIFPDAPASLET